MWFLEAPSSLALSSRAMSQGTGPEARLGCEVPMCERAS
jgi:hypothetical protein